MNLANYNTSRDYAELWKLAQENEIVCIIDHSDNRKACIARASLSAVSVRGAGGEIFAAWKKDEFADDCQSCNLEWLVPEEVETVVKDCDSCADLGRALWVEPCHPCEDYSNWRPKESEDEK